MPLGRLGVSLGEDVSLLSNKFTKFISGISLEMYLAHMVLFRLVEKLHINQFIKNIMWSYLLTCVLVIVLLVIGIVLYRRIENRIKQKYIM